MSSLIERLRAEREQALSRPRHIDLEVPGWGGMLWVRYAPLDWESTVRAIRDADTDDPQVALRSNLTALGNACQALMVRPDDDAELVSLADQLRAQGENVVGEIRFDAQAVDALGLEPEAETMTATVLAVFAGAVSPELAVMRHAQMLAAWMTGASLEVDAELGEGS